MCAQPRPQKPCWSPTMSSSRTQQRRAGPSLVPSPHPKPTLTIDQWDSKAPLNDTQVRCVGALKDACARRPLPLKVPLHALSFGAMTLLHWRTPFLVPTRKPCFAPRYTYQTRHVRVKHTQAFSSIRALAIWGQLPSAAPNPTNIHAPTVS